jgi:hypothetical protein
MRGREDQTANPYDEEGALVICANSTADEEEEDNDGKGTERTSLRKEEQIGYRCRYSSKCIPIPATIARMQACHIWDLTS